MSTMLPPRFLLRVAYPCPRVAEMPGDPDADELVTLPESAKLDPLTGPGENLPRFADVRLGWNAAGLGVTVEVRGKGQPALGDPSKPLASDGLTLWIDTRDSRTSHRAGRHCHQFHLLAAGGGDDATEAAFTQTKIKRALQDAPIAGEVEVPFRGRRLRGGYRLEAFLPAAALNGYDPDENPRLGVFYAVRDLELGEQALGLSADFPYAEDPSLWSALDLVR